MNLDTIKVAKKLVDGFEANFVIPQLASDGSNASDFCCADVVGNRRFAQNFGGYPRNDIAEINAQADVALQAEMLSMLSEIPVSDANSGLTDVQIMLGHKSKYIQEPAEMQAWLVEQMYKRDAERAQVQKSSDDSTIKFDSNDSNGEVNE